MSYHAQEKSRRVYSPRQGLHLASYDYQTAGYYALTICAYNRLMCLFAIPLLADILTEEWRHLARQFAGITPDLIMVMPDHLHSILRHHGPGAETKSVIKVIDGYKSRCAVAWIRHLNATQAKYCEPLWQRGFYDDIIRDEKDLKYQRAYMLAYPIKAPLKPKPKEVARMCEYASCGHMPLPPASPPRLDL